MTIDVERARSCFPALAGADAGVPRVFFDNPAGTQVPLSVLRRMEDYLVRTNANRGGPFRTSLETDAVVEEARAAMADFLGAASPEEVVFGANMTTLTIALAHALAGSVRPGDELVVTRLDHDANVAPWLRLAEERGARVRRLDFDPDGCRLRLEELDDLLGERTRVVALGLASNLVGTVNPVAEVIARVRALAPGALIFVDAVHYAPHGPVDVGALGADLLACSPYKFFGPHLGVLWGKRELLESLPAYRVRPAGDRPPGKFETGTQSHEAIAGLLGTLEYLEALGVEGGATGGGRGVDGEGEGGRRDRLRRAMGAVRAHELGLSGRLVGGLAAIPGVTLYGLTDPAEMTSRVPTAAFTVAGATPREVAVRLAEENIFVWDGHSYAVEVVERLGLAKSGGVVRAGAVHYNTPGEIDRLVAAVEGVAADAARGRVRDVGGGKG